MRVGMQRFNEVEHALPKVSLTQAPLALQPGVRYADSTCDHLVRMPRSFLLMPFRGQVPVANLLRFDTPERRL